ncbi:aggregation factor core [Roseobacter ponti]|uniref:Aggregation factor core n=1 Tax=Roseobacter ponti TaxID=1891787 RepID=A0A858SVN3_9RHOB|nr:aggregation factor core [Roseobacter ponti]QJF52755.1 aggregation factor core [Roseobacter ponti]
MTRLISAAFMILAAQPGLADIAVRFTESAPKDRFVIENTGNCALSGQVTLDLNGSAGGLIFDVTGNGAGVQVYQPFELVVGGDALTGLPEVRDGDQALVLEVRGLAPGETIAFTIDVDDTASARGTMVSGSEITGAAVAVAQPEMISRGSFSGDATAKVSTAACPTA